MNLSETYAKVYNWQDHCNRLVEIMHNISRGKEIVLSYVRSLCFYTLVLTELRVT